MGGCFRKRIKFQKSKLTININLEKLYIEFLVPKKETAIFLDVYWLKMLHGEWGQIAEKPIVFMEMKTKQFNIKSKTLMRPTEIIKLIKTSNKTKISIYFETTIPIDPISIDYKTKNNMWVSYIGGIYDFVNPEFSIENETQNIIDQEIENIENIDKKKFDKICEETAKTAIEMRINNLNWKKFHAEI